MENSQKIYEELLLQYEDLNDVEKNAILVYKSKLFVIINSISKIVGYDKLSVSQIIKELPNKEECINVFNSYSKTLSDLKNKFIKNTVFSNIRFDTFENLISDLIIIIDVLNTISFKLILNDDTIVYRSILVDKNKEFDFINDSPSFISTSIKIDDAELFLNGDNTKDKHFYKIKLNKGVPVIVSPFTVVRKYDSPGDELLANDNYSLMISNRGIVGQQEITLFKNLISYEEISDKMMNDEEENIFLHSIEVSLKENVYSNNEVNFK